MEACMRHNCTPYGDIFPHGDAGDAITACVDIDGDDNFWVCNDELETRINFCPYCGKRSKEQIFWRSEK